MVTLPTPTFVRAPQPVESTVPRPNVLLLGTEPVLQSTRAKILEKAGFDCFLACDLSKPCWLSEMFQIVVLCQTLDSTKACQIQEILRKTSPSTTVLRLAKRTATSESCFEHHLLSPAPAELISAVRLLSCIRFVPS